MSCSPPISLAPNQAPLRSQQLALRAKGTVSCGWVGSFFCRIRANTAMLPQVFKACGDFPAAPTIKKDKYLPTTNALAFHQWIGA